MNSMSSKYPWPASRLRAEKMHLLYEARARLKIPMSELLRLAVEKAYPMNKRQGGDSNDSNQGFSSAGSQKAG